MRQSVNGTRSPVNGTRPRKSTVMPAVTLVILLLVLGLGLVPGTPAKFAAVEIALAQQSTGQNTQQQAPASRLKFEIEAPSAILIEASTGQVLYAKNADEKLPPASLTKIMTMLLVMEAVERGSVNLEDKVTVSSYAAGMGGSQVYLAQGEVFSLQDLMRAIAIASANDASVAVAEYLAGSETSFVNSMNARAKELGMTSTFFANTNGLPADKGEDSNFTTARDVSIMARQLVMHPKVLEWTSTQTYLFREQPRFVLYNTNKLIGRYPGADGLKTGHTSEAGFSLAATAERDGMRLISVVMKTASDSDRIEQTERLLDWGFRTYALKEIAKKGTSVGQVEVAGGKQLTVDAVASSDFSVVARRAEAGELRSEILARPDLKAPVSRGDPVGQLVVYDPAGEEIGRTGVVAAQDVEKASIFVILFRWLKSLFQSIFS